MSSAQRLTRRSLRTRHILLASVVVFSLNPLSLAIAGACAPLIGPSALNVMEGGYISIKSNGGTGDDSSACGIQFTGSDVVNVTDPSFYTGTNPACPLEATGINLGKLSLPTHLCTTAGCVTSSRSTPSPLWFGQWSAGQYDSTAISNFDGTAHYTIAGELYYFKNNNLTKINKYDGITASGATSFNVSNEGKNPVDDTSNYKDMTVGIGTSATFVKENSSTNFVVENLLLRDTGSNATLLNGRYGKISIQGNNTLTFKYTKQTPNVPYVIDEMDFTNWSTINMEPGDYYIRSFKNSNSLVLNVVGEGDGSGKVRLYIADGASTTLANNSGSCYNISGVTTIAQCIALPAPTPATANGQDASKLGIYIYNGDMKSYNALHMAASVYVHNGNIQLTNNASSFFIGEMLASNIWVQNSAASNTLIGYQPTGTFDALYNLVSIPKTGEYSLAPPAMRRINVTGDMAYIASQTDLNSGSTPTTKRAGYLRAFAFKNDGTTETTEGHTFGTTDWDGAATNNPKERLSTNWDTYIGLPNGTQPMIHSTPAGHDLIFMTTSDGNLYVLKGSKTELTYLAKWTPTSIAATLSTMADSTNAAQNAEYESFLKSDPMKGQMQLLPYTGGVYVVGSAKGGALVYALQVTDAGAITKLWEDTRGGINPSRPILFNVGTDGYAVYIADKNKVIRRKLATPTAATATDEGTGTILLEHTSGTGANKVNVELTAAPIGVEKMLDVQNVLKKTISIYLGDIKGDVYQGLLVEDDALKATLGESKVGNIGAAANVTEPVLFLEHATKIKDEYLTAQNKTRLKVFKKSSEGEGSLWTSYTGGSGKWNWPGTTYTAETVGTDKTQYIQPLPAKTASPFMEALITDKVNIAGSTVFLPVREETDTTCKAFLYLYDLEKGVFPNKVLYKTSVPMDNVLIGYGTSFRPSVGLLNGRLVLQGHSEQNATAAQDGLMHSDAPKGLDNPFFFPTTTRVSGWRELVNE